MSRTIIAIVAPPGTDLTPALSYLERAGAVELGTPSLLYIDAGPAVTTKRVRKKLVLLRGVVETLLSVHVRLGAGSSKIVSLVAARNAPPGGMIIVPPGEETMFFERVVIDLLPGIGRRTATYLRNRGVRTIAAFSRLPQSVAVRLFGISGIVLREFSRGADPREVLPSKPTMHRLRDRYLPSPSLEQSPATRRSALAPLTVQPDALPLPRG